MQLILYLIILFGCSYIGYGIGNYYVKRQRFIMDLLSFCGTLKAEISFSHNNLSDIVISHINDFDYGFKSVLKGYLKTLKKTDYVTVENLKKNITTVYLEENEQNEMLQFFNFLGKSDVDNQVYSINKFMTSFNSFLNQAKEQKEKYSTMFKKLGFLTGVLISIIML